MNNFKLILRTSQKKGQIIYLLSPKIIFNINNTNKTEGSYKSITTLIPYSKQNLNNKQQKTTQFDKIAQCYGWRYRLIEPYLFDFIRNQNYKIQPKNQKILQGKISNLAHYFQLNQDELIIQESFGIRLAILFLLVNSVANMGDVDKIRYRIMTMVDEELYYWFANIFNEKLKNRGIKALKILILQ